MRTVLRNICDFWREIIFNGTMTDLRNCRLDSFVRPKSNLKFNKQKINNNNGQLRHNQLD